MGIRLVVLDDNPHVAWEGRIHAVSATFQRFVAGLLELPGRPVAAIRSCVPVGDARKPPQTHPLDGRIEVVPTAPFDGIAGYLRAARTISRANRPVLRAAIADAHLVWLKVPASNAWLAASIAAKATVPRFVWVAGSARDVAESRFAGVRRLAAIAVGAGYDAVGRVSGFGGDRVVVGREVLASLVEPDEIRPASGPWPGVPWRLRIAWAGRLAEGKGVERLLEALAILVRGDDDRHRSELVLLGDGPAAGAIEALASRLGVRDRLHLLGFVADRATYLDALASADAFVFPSTAEGFPKVLLDAMAVARPIVAVPAGEIGPLIDAGVVAGARSEAGAIAEAVSRLLASPDEARRLREAGTAFVREHTRTAEAARLVERWRGRWPDMPWT